MDYDPQCILIGSCVGCLPGSPSVDALLALCRPGAQSGSCEGYNVR